MRTSSSGFWFAMLAAFAFQSMFAAHLYASENGLTFGVSPQKVEINSFYHGTTLLLKGTVPAGSRVALVLSGEKMAHTLNRKGKVGPFWMNVDTITVKGAPEMYYVATSTDKQEELASSEVLANHCIGYGALRKSVTIEPENSGSDSMFPEFIKLKEHMGLYKAFPGAVKLKPINESLAGFVFSLPIPSLVSPGDYEISMYCFTEDQSFSSESSELIVEKVGMPKLLSALASDHAALYGILAIAVAIAAGLFMGLLFRKREQGGH